MRWRREDGQSTVEFALILPILVLLVFGMVDFGWLFFNKIEVNNASREGARYAVVHHEDGSYIGDTQSLVQSFASGASVSVSPSGESITVTVSKNVPILTGVASTFLGSSKTLTSSCTMRKE